MYDSTITYFNKMIINNQAEIDKSDTLLSQNTTCDKHKYTGNNVTVNYIFVIYRIKLTY